MKRILYLFSLLFMLFLPANGQSVGNVFGFPAAEPGYSLGVSACYAGQIGDWLVVAGGCNFPVPGHKTYYAGIYAARLDNTVLDWRLVGMLPEPAAYGVTVASGDSLLFIGGNNSKHGLGTVYSVHLDADGSRAALRSLSRLPFAADNMSVAKAGDAVYVVGGNQDGKPSSRVLRLDLASPAGAWSVVGDMPGSPRVQPVSAAYNNKVYVWGGFFADGEKSEVHTDGCCLDIATGRWTPLAAPRSVDGSVMTLSGGVAWADGSRIVATGGVNKDIFLDAISGRYRMVDKDDYLKQPVEWYRFSGNLCVYDTAKKEWQPTAFADHGLARAGAQVVPTRLGCFYIGGELKPSVRTPQIALLGF